MMKLYNNEDWIPVSRTGMTLWRCWNDTPITLSF
ncbi:hypothetical protein HET73_04090 [Wolbachia endosymbiont of Atemnus politus]|nr:WPE palindromic element domain-containing protein [Wolbachia endosymbiont of Atemnus politus]NSM56631.1 hypothetical protein [Wolbachia endosymbiont of Atemnus politus]